MALMLSTTSKVLIYILLVLYLKICHVSLTTCPFCDNLIASDIF